SKVFGDFHLKHFLTNVLSSQGAVNTFFRTRVFQSFVFGIIAIISIRMLSETGRGKVFIDRKSTRLNSSHVSISYAVFCLNKKKKSIVNRIIQELSSFKRILNN